MTTTPRHEAFEIDRPLTIRLKHISGDVTVTASASSQCRVTLTAHSPEAQTLVDEAQIEFSTVGSVADVDINVGRDGQSVNRGVLTLFWVFKHGIQNAKANNSVDVHLEVPEGTSVNLSSISGDIDSSAAVTGRTELKSVSGYLRSGLVHGSAQLKTTSGAIEVLDVLGSLEATSVSGSVKTGAVHGAIDIKTVSGSISTCIAVPASVFAKTVSGSIEINVTPGLPVSVDAKSVSGRLRSTIALDESLQSAPSVDSRIFGAAPSPATSSRTTSAEASVSLSSQSVSGNILIQTLPSV
ncbi:MAG: hypothetical protein EBS41_01710 [Actinobacteria bacterium]|nr:hypothetical protein [Actinomycetota bacterium]